MSDLRPGQILEATLVSGDRHRIVVTAVGDDGKVSARSIAHKGGVGYPWEARLGVEATWYLSTHEWRVI